MVTFRRIGGAALLIAVLTFGAARAGAHETYRYVGTIAKLDPKGTWLTVKWTVKGKVQTVEVAIVSSTSVTKNGIGMARSVLKPGLSVVVLAEEDDDTGIFGATDIMLVPPLQAAKSR
jgi:hypothetical protein